MRGVVLIVAISGCLSPGLIHNTEAAGESAGQAAAGMVAGIREPGGISFVYNEKTFRLEARDPVGNLLDEFPAGVLSRPLDAAGIEYRISFGKDEVGRPSLIVRPGPATRTPLPVEVFGRKAVLSPNASLMATLGEDRQVYYEPSICGEVYYIEEYGVGIGNRVSRLASPKREVAVLAKPSYPGAMVPEEVEDDPKELEGMKKAGEGFKSALFTVFGLPDKQTTASKAKVYRLKGGQSQVQDKTKLGSDGSVVK